MKYLYLQAKSKACIKNVMILTECVTTIQQADYIKCTQTIISYQNTYPAFRLDVKTEKKEKENVYLLTQGLHVKNYQASKLIRHVNVFHYQHRKTQEEYTTLAGFKHFEMYCPSCMDIFFLHQVYKYSFPFICVSICSMKTFLEERKIKSYV